MKHTLKSLGFFLSLGVLSPHAQAMTPAKARVCINEMLRAASPNLPPELEKFVHEKGPFLRVKYHVAAGSDVHIMGNRLQENLFGFGVPLDRIGWAVTSRLVMVGFEEKKILQLEFVVLAVDGTEFNSVRRTASYPGVTSIDLAQFQTLSTPTVTP